MKKFQPMLRNLTKVKKSFMICLHIKIMIEIRLVWISMKILQRKFQKKSKLEDVFIKKQPFFKNSNNSYNDYHSYARNDFYAYSNRRYNNHARYQSNVFYQHRRDNFRIYDSMHSSANKHVNTRSIWISKELNVDERKQYIISHL